MPVKVTYSSLREAREIAKERGCQAASFGQSAYANPYISKEMREAWESGYAEFMKRTKEK